MKNILKKIVKTILRTYVKHFPIYLNGFWFYMGTRNIELVPFMIFGKFQKGMVKTLEKIVQKGWVVSDVGSYIGDNTALLSKLVGKKGKVISFEPEPDHFKLLQKSIKLNKLKNVDLHQAAVSDKEGWGTIYTPEVNSPDSRLFKVPGEQRMSHKVKVTTLDKVLGKERKVDLIIIDVQGWEEKTLLGARKLLTKNKDIILISEFWPEGLIGAKTDPKKYLKLIGKFKFKMHLIDELSGKVSKVKTVNELLAETPKADGGFVNLLCTRKPLSRYQNENN